MWHSKEFRELVVKYSYTNSIRKAEKHFGVSSSQVVRWRRKKKNNETLENKAPNRKGFQKVTEEKLKEILDKNPDAFQKEIALECGCNDKAVSAALKKFGYKIKKNEESRSR